jgi:glycosyltransferase involved in cell wall biosynthesis
MQKISCVIITFNEEKNIERCLNSLLPVADEIIVVDSYSTDQTEALCSRYPLRFIKQKFLGYIEQKNFAVSHATHNMVLALDADEALSDELQQSILQLRNGSFKKGYTMNRLTRYCDKWIYHCGWYPDVKLRLFNRKYAHWGGTNPHDKVIIDPTAGIAHLQGDLLHYSYASVADHVRQVEKFSKIGALAKLEKGESSYPLKTWMHVIASFLKTYFLKRGFLDGYYGWIIARLSAREVYLRYRILEKYKKTKQPPSELKLLHISTADSWRGGEQQISYLAGELKINDFPQVVICPAASPLNKLCHQKNIPVISYKKRWALDIYLALKIKKICRQQQFAILHTHDSHAHTAAFLSAILFRNKTPIVVSRRVDFPISSSVFSTWKYNHKCIKKIVCVSEAIKNIAAPSIVNKNKLSVIYDGIDLSKFKKPTGKLKNEYGLDPRTVLIGNVSALADHKDLFTFIDVAFELKKINPQLRFFIIGHGHEREKLAYHVKNKKLSEEVLFTGFRNDINEILPELNLFLMTSKTEGLGTTILDAFVAGVPVVATAAGGIPEIVKNNETGLLASVGDVKTLTVLVNQLLQDTALQKKLTTNAHQFVKHFSKEEMCLKTTNLYKEVYRTFNQSAV